MTEAEKNGEFWDALTGPKVYLERSRIRYQDERDDRIYRSNVVYDAMRELMNAARSKGYIASEYINKSIQATSKEFTAETVELARSYAYFAGCDARRAFTVAQLVLDMYEEHQKLGGFPVDFTKL
jgi:hypothetical protein